MVTHHHFVGYHQRLHVTLAANWALKGQLPAADVMWRCLQCPLPPRRALHRLLIWGGSHKLTFWTQRRNPQKQPTAVAPPKHFPNIFAFTLTCQEIDNDYLKLLPWPKSRIKAGFLNFYLSKDGFLNIFLLFLQRPETQPMTIGSSGTTTSWLLRKSVWDSLLVQSGHYCCY